MKINRHNYEAYLLDFLEGRLSVEDQQQLHDFLLLNPDCADELTVLEPLFLEPTKIQYPEKGMLKRELPDRSTLLTDHNFDLFSIARMEGDLTIEQEEAHRKMVAEDIQKKQSWMNWQQTKLAPAEVVYRDKEGLTRKRGISRRVIWTGVISAAAAIAMVIVLIRVEPGLPQQELSMQTNSGTNVEQPLDVQDQPASQVELPVMEETQEVELTPVLPMQKPKSSAMFSVKRDHERPIQTATEMNRDQVPADNLQPRPLKVSDNRVYLTSLAGDPVPDQIKPLDIPPVPIHLSSLSVAQISELDLQEVLVDYTEEKNISFWSIASAGIKGINKIAKSDISLLASRDEEGEVSGFRLKSKRFSLTRPVGHEE